jgi:ADP-ribosylglycohydrolase
METKDKILGSILGAAVGDAMGAVTETRSAERIKEDFKGYVEDLLTPPDDCFARGYPLGSVTDDFSLAYFTGKALVDCGGKVDRKVADDAVLTWASYPYFFRFAGPTTEASVRRMKGEEVVNPRGYVACDNSKGTNGGGMKIFCVGLVNPGNVDKAIEDSVTICLPTHFNNVAISGAAAIAAAVAAAMTPDATLDKVIEAGIYGARRGFEIGSEKTARLAMPSVEKRIALAAEIGRKGLPWEQAMLELRDIVGAGLMATEAIPCTFGILAATPGDAFAGIRMGVNIGDDTDTVATMVGAVAGALYGTSNIPMRYLDVIDKVNGFDLKGLAEEIEAKFYS